jgi:uncharacterized membrane protein YeaQ/YmgE (transglycosylase-associated protein family)
MTNDRTPGIASLLATVPLVLAQNGRDDLDVGSILGYVLVGLVVGLLARLIVPGRDPFGLLGTILLGIVGAAIGGWLAGEVFEETEGVDWIASIVVAAVLVLLLRAGTRRSLWGR